MEQVPIQLKMMEVSLLSKVEVCPVSVGQVIHSSDLILSWLQVEWVNNYHATCFEVVGAHLRKEGKIDVVDWLQRETLPIQFNL